MSQIVRAIEVIFLGGAKPRVRAHVIAMAYARDRGWKRFARWVEARMQLRYGVFLSHRARFSASLVLKHPVGIVIGEGVSLGERVTIYQHVTIGGARMGDSERGHYPDIEDDVVIFAGAVVIGNVRVGRGATVGANSVVTRDVPAYSTVAGAPARVIREGHPVNATIEE